MKRNLMEAIYNFMIYKTSQKFLIMLLWFLSALQRKQVSERVHTAEPGLNEKSWFKLAYTL